MYVRVCMFLCALLFVYVHIYICIYIYLYVYAYINKGCSVALREALEVLAGEMKLGGGGSGGEDELVRVVGLVRESVKAHELHADRLMVGGFYACVVVCCIVHGVMRCVAVSYIHYCGQCNCVAFAHTRTCVCTCARACNREYTQYDRIEICYMGCMIHST